MTGKNTRLTVLSHRAHWALPTHSTKPGMRAHPLAHGAVLFLGYLLTVICLSATCHVIIRL